MHTQKRRFLSAMAVLLISQKVPQADEFRRWKDKKGREVEARIVSADLTKVQLETGSGRRYTVNLPGLSEDDRVYVLSGSWMSLERAERLTEEEHAIALTALGHFYVKGKMVEKDQAKGISLLEEAVRQGNWVAASALGEYCREGGGGMTQDLTKAAKYYRIAADAGDHYAQFWVGNFYHMGGPAGGGLPKDDVKALHWWSKAADGGAGYSEANTRVAWCHELGWGGVQPDPVKAREWHRLALDCLKKSLAECHPETPPAARADICSKIARHYRDGKGVDRDDEEAARWKQKAWELDIPNDE